ncbi:MAG: replicative DNA helicase [Clostridiales bacterium]|nr:replicative DNA helicase [Clostridiales bacterium]
MAEENSNIVIKRIPPNDINAEQAVLGCMFFDIDGIRAAVDTLRSSDFYRPDHQAVFTAIQELFNAGETVDIITVKNRLEEKGLLEQVGGVEYLITLNDIVGTSVNCKKYCEIVSDKALLRRLIKASAEISEECYEGRDNVDNIMQNAEKRIFDIVTDRRSEDFIPIRELISESISTIEEAGKKNSRITGIPTGYLDFDYITAGLQNSDLILIAARPSMGKTAFALNIAQYVSVKKNIPTAIFSLEMSAGQLVNRFISSEARVDANRLKTGKLENDDWMKVLDAVGEISQAPIYIDDTSITPMEIRAKCRKLKLEQGLGLIVIDYLQLMSMGQNVRRNDSTQAEVAMISKSLKQIAKELDVPLIALSQLSRANESRKDKRPMLSDLRDSGAIEQDADIVCFLFRQEYYEPENMEVKGKAEVIIAKHRNGSVGSIFLKWLGMFTRFENLEKDEYPQISSEGA